MRAESIKEAFSSQSEKRYLVRVNKAVDTDQVRAFCRENFDNIEPEDLALQLSRHLPESWRPQISFNGRGGRFQMDVELYAPGKEAPVLTGEWSINKNFKSAIMVKVVSQEKGKGYGANHSYDVFDFLKNQEIKTVSLEAAMSSGGYVWAALGMKRDMGSPVLEVLDMSVLPKLDFLKKIEDPLLQEKLKDVTRIVERLQTDQDAVNDLALYEKEFDLTQHGLDEDFIQALYEVGRRQSYSIDNAEMTLMGSDTRQYMMACIRDKRNISIGQFLLVDGRWSGSFDLTDPNLLPDFAKKIGRKVSDDAEKNAKPKHSPLSGMGNGK